MKAKRKAPTKKAPTKKPAQETLEQATARINREQMLTIIARLTEVESELRACKRWFAPISEKMERLTNSINANHTANGRDSKRIGQLLREIHLEVVAIKSTKASEPEFGDAVLGQVCQEMAKALSMRPVVLEEVPGGCSQKRKRPIKQLGGR